MLRVEPPEMSKIPPPKRERGDTPFAFQLTSIQGNDSEPRACSLKDIIPEDAKKVLIVNYIINIEWLLRVVPYLPTIKDVGFIHQRAQGKVDVKQYCEKQGLNISLGVHIIQKLPRNGCHHTKMFVVFLEDRVKIAVGTANLIEKDWTMKSQGWWIQTFPLKNGRAPRASAFENDLTEYFGGYSREESRTLTNMLASISQSLSQYDFSQAQVHLVASVPSRNNPNFGHLRLRRLLEEQTPSFRFVTMQCSSLGSYGLEPWEEWMKSITAGMLEGHNVSLVWPSIAMVQNSLEGLAAGTSIFASKVMVQKHFVNSILRQWSSEHRARAAPHIKLYCAHNEKGTELAWCLLTSSNISKSAWGNTTKEGQYVIKSYELGVLWRSIDHPDKKMVTEQGAMVKEDEMVFPIPHDLPGQPFGVEDEPWTSR